MVAIQMDLGWFDKKVRLLAATLCRFDRKLPFLGAAYIGSYILSPFEAWLMRLGPRVGGIVQNFLNVPLGALLYCLIFFSLFNFGVQIKRAYQATLILSCALFVIRLNLSIFMNQGMDVLLDGVAAGLGLFVGYAIVQYYLVTSAIGKWE